MDTSELFGNFDEDEDKSDHGSEGSKDTEGNGNILLNNVSFHMLHEWLHGKTTEKKKKKKKKKKKARADSTTTNVQKEIWESARALLLQKENVDKEIIAKMILGVDITEVYSRPRVAEACSRMGLVGGSSFDLRTGWDFTIAANRAAAIEVIKREAPRLLIGSQPCTKLSNLQNLIMAFRSESWKARFVKYRERDIQNLQ